jgi:secondary thiamine-phosphate synthase enzyme
MIQELQFKTNKHNQMLDITPQISNLVKDIKEGVATIFVKHTTAGITINENADPDVQRDILWKLGELVPNQGFHHSEGNSDAHIKASLMGSSVQVIVKDGKLQLGTWQGIFLCEFDGPRERKVILHI